MGPNPGYLFRPVPFKISSTLKQNKKTIFHHIGQFQPQPHNLTLLCMPSVLHFSKVRYLCIERPCFLLQKRVLGSLKDICMIVNLNINEFALSHPMGSRWPHFMLPIHICYPVVFSIYQAWYLPLFCNRVLKYKLTKMVANGNSRAWY